MLLKATWYNDFPGGLPLTSSNAIDSYMVQ